MRVGLLGGTFNPIHLAHLRIAEEVREACGLERVLFVPAFHPPHKEPEDALDFHHRLAMVGAAVADNPYFAVSDVEARRGGKSYSVHTLEILRREQPDNEFYFVMGMDSFREIASWHDYERLFSLCHLVVATRPGHVLEAPLEMLPVAAAARFCYDSAARKLIHQSGFSVIFVSETCLDISSTRIRELASAGRSLRYLVAPAVEDYIHRHQLYRGVARS